MLVEYWVIRPLLSHSPAPAEAACHNENVDDEDQEHRDREEGRHEGRLNADSIGCHAHMHLRLFVLHPASAHQQSMGIDAIRGTGHECTQVQPGLNLQFAQVCRLNHGDFIDLVGQGLVQDGEIEHIPDFHDVQVTEESRGGKATVSTQHAMTAIRDLVKVLFVRMETSHRERRAFDMAHGGLQYAFACTVIQRQVDIRSGDGDIAHIAGTVHVEEGFVIADFLLIQEPSVLFLHQGFIIGEGTVPDTLILLIINLGDLFSIADNRAGLMEGIPVFTEGRVNEQTQSDKENKDKCQVHPKIAFLFHCCVSYGAIPRRARGGSLFFASGERLDALEKIPACQTVGC